MRRARVGRQLQAPSQLFAMHAYRSENAKSHCDVGVPGTMQLQKQASDEQAALQSSAAMLQLMLLEMKS